MSFVEQESADHPVAKEEGSKMKRARRILVRQQDKTCALMIAGSRFASCGPGGRCPPATRRFRFGGVLIVLCVSLAACLASPLPATAQARKKSPPEALQIYSDAASFQNNKVYDLAVEEWTKFLTKFGTDPLAPKAWHYLGVCYLQLEKPNHAKAIEALETVIKQYPDFELLQDTYLDLGSSQYALAGQGNKALYAKAAETFAALV